MVTEGHNARQMVLRGPIVDCGGERMLLKTWEENFKDIV